MSEHSVRPETLFEHAKRGSLVAGLTTGGAANEVQNSTVSAFLYGSLETSDLLMIMFQDYFLISIEHLRDWRTLVQDQGVVAVL